MSDGRIEELRRRVEKDPSSIAFAQLGEEYRRVGRFADAVATCRAGLGRHPGYHSARVTLGRALMALGEYDQASDELAAVLRAAPENLAALRGLAEVARRRGQPHEALEMYTAASERAPNDPEIEQAIAELQREVLTAPKPTRVLGTEVHALPALERWLEAILRDRQARASREP